MLISYFWGEIHMKRSKILVGLAVFVFMFSVVAAISLSQANQSSWLKLFHNFRYDNFESQSRNYQFMSTWATGVIGGGANE